MARQYKKNRKKLSPLDAAYLSYSRQWSKMFGKGTPRMSKEEFMVDADMRGVDLDSKEALLRAARQRVASAAHQLTTEQARNLRRELLNLSDADLEIIGMPRADVRAMTMEGLKYLPTTNKGKAMISRFYDILRAQGLSAEEAGRWISSEIYGS